MEEHIKKIQELEKENQAITKRTPWLDISLGGLRTAIEHAGHHQKWMDGEAAKATAVTAAPATNG